MVPRTIVLLHLQTLSHQGKALARPTSCFYLNQAPHEQHSTGAENQNVFWVDAIMADNLSEHHSLKFSTNQHFADKDCLADVIQAISHLPSLLSIGGPEFCPIEATK